MTEPTEATPAWLPEPAPPDADTLGWWEATQDWRLCFQRCSACGHAQFYPRSLCTSCGHVTPTLVTAAGTGIVYSYTTVYRAPAAGMDTPYVIALVRLLEGPTLLTRIVGCDGADLRCDMSVEVDWVDIVDGRRMPVFRPIDGR